MSKNSSFFTTIPTNLPSLSSSPHPYILISSACVLGILFIRKLLDIITPKPIPGIPHLEGQVPIFGDAVKMMKWVEKHDNMSTWFDDVAYKLGKDGICQVVLGFGRARRLFIITDWQEADDINSRRSPEFDRSEFTMTLFKPTVPTSTIATPTNARWKHHRRSLGPTMTSSALRKFSHRSAKAFAELIELWKLKIEKTQSGLPGVKEYAFFNAMDDIGYTTMDAICDITFAKSTGCLDMAIKHVEGMKYPLKLEKNGAIDFDHENSMMYKAIEYMFKSVPIRSPVPALSAKIMALTPTHRKQSTIIHNWISTQMETAQAIAAERGSDAASMADSAIDMACLKQSGDDKLPENELRDELFIYVVAGQDTTGTSLSWGVKYLTDHPEVQLKIRAEVLGLELDGRLPLFDDMTAEKTPYIEAVVWEMLRLAEPASGISRTAVKDAVVLGHVIPKGSTLLFPMGKFARDPEYKPQEDHLASVRSESSLKYGRKVGYWNPEDVKEFKPERWLDPSGNFDIRSGPFGAFGIGQRSCFGFKLAILQMKMFVTQISMAFFLEKAPPELSGYADKEIVMRKPKFCYVSPRPWEDSDC